MNILITGGAGFLGSALCEALHTEHTLIVIDDLRDGNRSALPASVTFFEGDYCGIGLLEAVFTKYEIDCVLHCAGSSGADYSIENPDVFYKNNVAGMVTLLSVMRRHKVNKILFASSAAVYGDQDINEIDERTLCKPLNPYAQSKLIAETILKDYAVSYGLKYIIFRLFTVAGATALNGEYRGTETHLLPNITDHLLGRKQAVSIFGNTFRTPDGTPIRDYIHIADVVRAFLLGIEKIDVLRKATINIGSGKGYSVLEVIKECERLLERKILSALSERRATEPSVLVSSKELAYRLLGWVPQHTLHEIIHSSYEWRKNPRYE